MQLSSLVLVLAACQSLLAAEPQQQPQLSCPDLKPELVCAAAEAGFDYSDGCNGLVCSGSGLASTTLMACQPPRTPEELRRCEQFSRSVWGRLGPFTCPNVNPADTCASRGPGFAFSDGCNRVRCLQGGNSASTRMSCPVTDPEGPYCRYVASTLVAGAEPPEPRTNAVDEAAFECPNLHYSRVCAEYLPAFAYHDGCRQITCLASGLARVPAGGRDCPEPEAGNAAAAAYCAAAERRMLDKKARSSFQTSCLQADSVCRASRTAELAFHDGCNRCFCLPDRNAACTRVACPPKFLTPEEFSEHCKRVGAGVLTRK